MRKEEWKHVEQFINTEVKSSSSKDLNKKELKNSQTKFLTQIDHGLTQSTKIIRKCKTIKNTNLLLDVVQEREIILECDYDRDEFIVDNYQIQQTIQ